jgi:hypothetical protein
MSSKFVFDKVCAPAVAWLGAFTYYNYKHFRVLNDPYGYCAKRVRTVEITDWKDLEESRQKSIADALYPQKKMVAPGKFESVILPSFVVGGEALISGHSSQSVDRVVYRREYNFLFFKCQFTHDFRVGHSFPEVSNVRLFSELLN